MIRLAPLLFVAACGGPQLPDVQGILPAEDLDPARDVVEVHLTAAPTDISWVDGGVTPAWAYNGQVPGPLIQATVGDTLRVVFTNNLAESSTIHWHGLRVPNEMDGVPAVQTPVEPGETFTYEFVLPDAGTYWYHPHVRSNVQVEHGLYGMIVVHEAEPPVEDVERAFVLDDVALQSDGRFGQFLGGMEPMMGRTGNVLLVNGQVDPVVAEVTAGTTERWRIVNTANARTLFVNVNDADWRIIAIDGTLLDTPIDGDGRIAVPVGRRFDLEVAVGSVAPSLSVDLTRQEPIPVFTPTLIGDAPAPAFAEWSAPALPAQLPIEQEVELVFGVDAGPTWTINGVAYSPDDEISVQANTPTRITIREETGQPHPFHLHGQFFEIMDRTQGTMWPGQLDTLFLIPGSTSEVYTTFDNPGHWLAHCHILEHAELGMMTTFLVE